MIRNKNKKEILVVDDDPDYTELTRTRLTASGYLVSCAANGNEALKFLDARYRPDLIIMDIEMPDQNGLTTLIHLNIRSSRGAEKIPIVVATGLQSERVRDIIESQKVAGYLRKPFGSEELVETVKKIIG
ncbi:MAG: response regulator [Candidatus Omnitrophica bacterium]|nr:response regulator [Candidatus Omnitrophota bacterium]